MSTDYSAVCYKCRKHQHVGQRSGATYSMGYGSGDGEEADVAAQFVLRHAEECGSVQIVNADDVPESFLWIPTSMYDSDEPGYGRGAPGDEETEPNPYRRIVTLRSPTKFLIGQDILTDFAGAPRVIGVAIKDSVPDGTGMYIVEASLFCSPLDNKMDVPKIDGMEPLKPSPGPVEHS